MYKIGCFLMVVVVGATAASADDATSWELAFSGYSQEVYDERSGEVSNHRTRLRFNLTNGKKPCGFYAELDVSAAEDGMSELERGNWTQRFYATCTAGKAKVSFGRLFVRAGYGTYWPGDIITARYPKAYPLQGFYAYGVDVLRPFGKWEVAGTLSGASDLHFDDGGQFSRVEFAGRATRSLGERGHYSFAVQASDEFVHSMVEFSYDVGSFSYSGGLFSHGQRDTSFSALGQVEWKATGVVALHGQFEERTDGSGVLTTGFGFRVKGFYLVGDYEYNLDTRSGAFLAGARYNW